MALPLVKGLTMTGDDAEPIVYKLSDVIRRNPALLLAGNDQIMEVVGKIAERRSTVNDNIQMAIQSLEHAWDNEPSMEMRAEIMDWISDIRGDDND